MQHTIQVEQLVDQIGPQLEGMVRAIESCVHCGFCLPTCPTYQVLGEEMDSPRGRIVLMKSVLEGDLNAQEAKLYIDRCLGCLACVTSCPSGVRYEELVVPFRAFIQEQLRPSFIEKAQRAVILQTLAEPDWFRRAAGLSRLARPFRSLFPERMRAALSMLPTHLPPAKPLPKTYPALGKRRARVAFLTGCVQQALAPELNWATLRVLAQNGVEVLIPEGQVCCGALSMHAGELESARDLAQFNLDVFPTDVDAVLTNAAGCGSGMKAYEMLFKGLPEGSRAVEFSRRVMDVSEFLDEHGIMKPPPLPEPIKVAYHDACHLVHAQGIKEAPRRLLQAIPNLTLLEIPESELCCGSAGIYNIEQPHIAEMLGKRKAENIMQTEGEAVVTGNIGCMVQINKRLKSMGKAMPVYHIFEVLDMAYRQEG